MRWRSCRADLPLGGAVKAMKVSSVRKLPPPVKAEADEREALLQVVDYYHSTLKQSPEALAYLESRGLEVGGDDRTLQAGVRQPDAGAAAADEERGRQGQISGAGWRSSGSSAKADTSTSTARS